MQSKLIRIVYLGLILLCFLLATVGPGSAAEVNMTRIGSYDIADTGYDIAVSGNYAYIVSDSNSNYSNSILSIVNITIPSSPTPVGSYDTVGRFTDVAISGNYAYLTGCDNGLVILDVSNPSWPKHLAKYSTSACISDVSVSGNYAYLAGEGLIILDISNPSSPTLASTYNDIGISYVAVSGNYAYLADTWNGLIILDISNPYSPTLMSTYSYDASLDGVEVAGNYAYLADYYKGLVIIDISNPSSPTLKSTYDFTPSDVTYNARDIAISGNYVYVATTYYVGIVDVTTPSYPTLAGRSNRYESIYANCIVVIDNYVYMISGDSLGIYHITPPIESEVNLTFVGKYDATEVADVAVSGNYAYITGANHSGSLVSGFGDIVDITTPSSPTHMSSYSLANETRVTSYTLIYIAISGNYAYVTDYTNLVIVDISNPAAPKLAGSCNIASYANDVVVSGNYAYIASSNGLCIVDISDPSSPTPVYNYYMDFATGVTLAGNYAYISSDYYGLMILDISDPSTPTLKSNFDTGGHISAVAVSGNYAYVCHDNYAANNPGLVIVNITNPSSPKLTGSCKTDGSAKGVAISGNYAYIADDSSYVHQLYVNQLQVVNISNPSSPSIAGSYNTASFLTGVVVSSNYVYVSDYYNGLVVLRTDIQNQDRAPELTSIGNKTVNETELLSFTISAMDDDSDAITYSATDLPSGATFDASTKTFSWTPGTGTEGVYNVTFTATANGLKDSETIVITVSDWNPWNDPDSDGGKSINLFELQTAIYDWRFGVTLPTGELIDLSRLQSLIYQWRFG